MGNVMESESIIRLYPQNPPACSQCPPNLPPTWIGGFIDTPSNETCFAYFGPNGCTPTIQGSDSAAFLILYLIWSLDVVLSVAWACYKPRYKARLIEKGSRRTVRIGFADDEQQLGVGWNGSIGHVSDTDAGKEEDDENKAIQKVEYYRNTFAEKPATALLVLNGLVLMAYWLLLTVDFYLECEFPLGSIDNACFFGTFRIFGNYENNAESFFLVWGALVVYSLFVSMFLPNLYDWVRVECQPVDADFAKIYVKKEHVTVVADGKISCGIRVVKMVSDKLSQCFRCITKGDALLRDYKTTIVRIQITPFGRRYFLHECTRYSVPGEKRIRLTLDDCTLGGIKGLFQSRGLNANARRDMFDRCGKNAIPLESPSLLKMCKDEFTQPFYAYQLTIYLIWIWWTYWFVGVWLLAIVLIAGFWSVYVKRGNLLAVHALTENNATVQVCVRHPGSSSGVLGQEGDPEKHSSSQADSSTVTTNVTQLVCGDVVKVTPHSTIPADIVLVEGSCAVDESGLTGESIPKGKMAISHAKTDEHLVTDTTDPKWKTSVLFSGTRVIECAENTYGVVLSIGTDSTKGRMLSRVLFPLELQFRFNQEFPFAVSLLFLYSIGAFLLAMVFQASNGARSSWPTKVAYGVFTVSQIVSPMLKIALVAGRVSAVTRLKKKGIVCLDAQRIDVAGKVKVFCFDKTGTLTNDAIVLRSFIPMGGGSKNTENEEELARMNNQDNVKDEEEDGSVSLSNEHGRHVDIWTSIGKESSKLPLLVAASCHSISTFDRRLLGSPLEIALFESSKAKLTSADGLNIFLEELGEELIIRRRLSFDPTRRMMSCLVMNRVNGETFLVSKGALDSLSKRSPSNSDQESITKLRGLEEELASKGMYVLAFGLRRFHPLGEGEAPSMELLMNATREELEVDINLLGLAVFTNELKPDAKMAIQELERGNVRTVMVTGDNAPCAVHIAKECSMLNGIDPLLIGRMVYDDEAHDEDEADHNHNLKEGDVDLSSKRQSSSTNASSSSSSNSNGHQHQDKKRMCDSPVRDDLVLREEEPRHSKGEETGLDSLSMPLQGRIEWEDAATKEKVSPLDPAYASAQLVCADGFCFDRLNSTGEIHRYIHRLRVFARMNPAQKALCVEDIITLESSVCGFVGDGANDSAALRQASVGLSMSSSSDSVVASFACADPKNAHVMLVLDLLCEGRCSLATSLASYKLLVIYGLLFSVVKLASFYYAVLMPILGYIMIDVVALVPLTFLITLAHPRPELRRTRPTSSLLGIQTVGSVVSYLIWFLCALAANLEVMKRSEGYVRWPSHVANTAAWWYLSDNFESSTLWVTCFIFFAFSALIFSFGGDFRMPVYWNWRLLLYVLAMIVITVVVFLLPINPMSVVFHMASEEFNRPNSQNPIWRAYQAQGGSPSPAMSFDLRFSIFVVACAFVAFAAAVERYVIQGILLRRFQ